MLFIFLDESGNYTFSRKGTEFLIFTALSSQDPFSIHSALSQYEASVRKGGLFQVDYFHATEDLQTIRDGVFNILEVSNNYRVDAVIVEKRKANPILHEPSRLYKKIYFILLQYVVNGYTDIHKIVINVNTQPVNKKKAAFEKGLKESLSEILNTADLSDIKYHLQFLPSVSCYGLQAVDYCSWALKKKYGDWGEKIDLRPYSCIQKRVVSEFKIFDIGKLFYY